MLWGVKISENWSKRYNMELMQLFAGLDIISFVIIRQFNWTGRVNTMDSKRKVSQVINNYPQGCRLRGRPKQKQILIDAKLKTGESGKKSELTRRSLTLCAPCIILQYV